MVVDAGIQRQIELRESFFCLQPGFDKVGRLTARDVDSLRKAEKIEIDLEDRRAAEIAFRLQFFDQFLEWHILVGIRVQRRLSRAREELQETWIARQVGA